MQPLSHIGAQSWRQSHCSLEQCSSLPVKDGLAATELVPCAEKRIFREWVRDDESCVMMLYFVPNLGHCTSLNQSEPLPSTVAIKPDHKQNAQLLPNKKIKNSQTEQSHHQRQKQKGAISFCPCCSWPWCIAFPSVIKQVNAKCSEHVVIFCLLDLILDFVEVAFNQKMKIT